MGEKPVIIYDSREKKSFVVRYLKKFKEIVAVEQTLEIADYLIQTENKTIAIERKRASDFLNSIVDGRMFFQLENLQEYEEKRLILEGAILPNIKEKSCFSLSKFMRELRESKTKAKLYMVWATKHKIHPHALASTFEKLQKSGVVVIPTGGAYDTAELLRYWATKSRERGYISIRRKKVCTVRDAQIFLLSGLPGINVKRAEALLDEFGSPIKVFEAFLTFNPKKFPIKGIGEKTVKEIRKLLLNTR